jgi:hypothetical protein
MNPVKKILGKDVAKDRVDKYERFILTGKWGPTKKLKLEEQDTCQVCGLKVGKGNVYGKKGCSECAYLNKDNGKNRAENVVNEQAIGKARMANEWAFYNQNRGM